MALTGLVTDNDTSLRGVLIELVTGFAAGIFVAILARKDGEAWDRRPEA